MKQATIAEAKRRLNALIDEVKAGEGILIVDEGIPVARLEPVKSDPSFADWLERAERAGVITPRVAAPPLDLLRRPGQTLAGDASVDALLEERRESR